MARTTTLGAIVTMSATLFSGCGCAEIWSVAEELGSGPVDEESPDPFASGASRDDGTGGAIQAAEPVARAVDDPHAAERGERFGRHLAELCMRMRRGNTAFVEKHVDLPLIARLRADPGAGSGSFHEVVFENPVDLRTSGICADLTWLGASIDVEQIDGGWLVLASGTGSRVELEFRDAGKGRPKLTRYWQL